MGLVLGLLGLFLLLSFSSISSCQIAHSDIEAIKKHTQKALDANSLEMTKYYAYKALNYLEKTKTHLDDCGCEPAQRTAKDAKEHLEKAVQSTSVEDSKNHLKLALQNTLMTIDNLNHFEQEYLSAYSDDILVMNTKETSNQEGGVFLSPAEQLERKMNQSLDEFQNSLGAVVQHVDCEDAFNFINKVIEKSNRNLEQNTLTIAQRKYHGQVKNIALEALKELEGCPAK